MNDIDTKLAWGDYDDNVKDNIVLNEDNEDNKEPKQELFKKVVKKYNKKLNIPIVYELKEFMDCLNNKKKVNVDFIIDSSAHCEHTYKGTLCNNIRSCNKIHIQRCINGESCINTKCSFIHKFDMLDDVSKIKFEKSMATYNKIKPNKKVIN